MMRLLRRLFTTALVLGVLWIVLLAVVGELGGRWLALRIRTQVADALGAQVRLGGVDLGLVRGRFELAELEIERKDLGSMRLLVHEAVLEAAPLGMAMLHRDRADSLRLRGVRVELSSWAVLAPPPGRERSFALGRVELIDCKVTLAPTLLLPKVGAVTLEIQRAVSGATNLRSAASWFLSLQQLDATASFPGGTQVKVAFRAAPGGGGKLVLTSSLLGGELSIPVTLPSAASIREAADETAALRALVGQVAREIGKRKAVQALERLVR